MNRKSSKAACRPSALVPFVATVAALGMLAVSPLIPSSRTTPFAQDIRPFEELEKRLFEAVNGERVARGLPALRWNPSLRELARKQSEEMAGRGVLAHLSAAGRSYTERLVEAGILFAANAENVARGDSFDPDLIHEAFMNSPDHRVAILDPEFDEAGIALAEGAAGSCYVTQDFIKSVALMDTAKVRALVLGALGRRAVERAVPPLRADDDVHRTAQAFAEDKAGGRALPPVPREYGAASVRFFVGADVDRLLASVMEIEPGRFRIMGAGSTFARTPEHPGGAYVVCVFLLIGSPALDMNDAERRAAVLAAVNEVRAAFHRQPLDLDEGLCRKADHFNRRYQNRESVRPPRSGALSIVLYETSDLGRVPDEVKGRMADRAFPRVGISVLPPRPQTGLSVNFSVAVLFEH